MNIYDKRPSPTNVEFVERLLWFMRGGVASVTKGRGHGGIVYRAEMENRAALENVQQFFWFNFFLRPANYGINAV